jgi:hypothetical protein
MKQLIQNLKSGETYLEDVPVPSPGPVRYDENYEQKGWDYPIGFVRWTEKRNFEAVLQAMAGGNWTSRR